MYRRGTIAVAVVLAFLLLGGCISKLDRTSAPGRPDPSETPVNVSEHESGPESPIAYGMKVPRGATQVGPLVRIRSQKLIDAYQPELDAAIAAKKAKEAEESEDSDDDDEPDESELTPTPTEETTPATRPSDDSFKLLDDPPRPDTTISLMRIDEDPSDAVHRMITQIATVLPQAGIDTSDLRTYCDVENRRYTGCRLEAAGTTAGDRPIRIEMTVDPGDLETRSTTAGNHTKPVMTLLVQYVGDAHKGQLGDASDGIDSMPDPDLEADESDNVWPKMDFDKPPDTELFDDSWKPPVTGTILLSGTDPGFVAMAGQKIKDADADARDFARGHANDGDITSDTVEDLNEICTTYRSKRSDDKRYFATYVLSGRGSYAMLFSLPSVDAKPDDSDSDSESGDDDSGDSDSADGDD